MACFFHRKANDQNKFALSENNQTQGVQEVKWGCLLTKCYKVGNK